MGQDFALLTFIRRLKFTIFGIIPVQSFFNFNRELKRDELRDIKIS